MHVSWYKQDKKHRYYIVSALANTKVDLKGIYDFSIDLIILLFLVALSFKVGQDWYMSFN